MAVGDMKFATQTLTVSGQPVGDQTVIIGSKTYTFKDDHAATDGVVVIGATAAASLANLFNAINLGPGAGTAYASGMTKHPEVVAYAVTATTLVVRAAGAIGNQVGVSGTYESDGAGSWGDTELAGGEGNLNDALHDILDTHQVNSSVQLALKRMTVADD